MTQDEMIARALPVPKWIRPSGWGGGSGDWFSGWRSSRRTSTSAKLRIHYLKSSCSCKGPQDFGPNQFQPLTSLMKGAMPIYEYEPVDHDCLMCDGRVGVLQGVHDNPCDYCPTCGLAVRRVISSAQFKLAKDASPEKAASRGFTTYKRSQKGVWEKLAGEGADVMAGSAEDMAAIESEKKAPRVLDLDGS